MKASPQSDRAAGGPGFVHQIANLFGGMSTWARSGEGTVKGHGETVILWNTSKQFKLITGLWLGHPSEKYESQLGWWDSHYMGK